MNIDILAKALLNIDVDKAASDYRSDNDGGYSFAREIFDRLDLASYGFDRRTVRQELGDFMAGIGRAVATGVFEGAKDAGRKAVTEGSEPVSEGVVEVEGKPVETAGDIEDLRGALDSDVLPPPSSAT